MESKSLVIRMDAGKVPPDDFLEKACSTYKGAAGYGLVKEGKIIYEKLGGMPFTPELIKNISQLAPDRPIHLYLGNPPAGSPTDADNNQPFVFNDEKGVKLLCFMEGDFSKHAKKESKLTPEFWAFSEYIIPKLQFLCGLGYEKMIESLQQPIIKKELGMLYGEHGSIVFLFNNGKSLLTSESVGHTYDWGWSSNQLGFVPGKLAAAKAAVGSALGSMFGGAKPAPAPTETPTVLHDDVKDDDAAVAKLKTSTAIPSNIPSIPGIPGASLVGGIFYPPESIWTDNRKLKAFWNQHTGGCPRDYTKLQPDGRVPGVPISQLNKKSKAFAEAAYKAAADAPGPTDQPANKPAATPAPAGPPKPDPIPGAIPADKLKDVHDKFIKTVDCEGKDIMAPSTIEAIKMSGASFLDKMGLKAWTQTFGWSEAKIKQLCNTWPEVAANMIMWMRYDFAQQMEAEIKSIYGTDVSGTPEVPEKKVAAGGDKKPFRL